MNDLRTLTRIPAVTVLAVIAGAFVLIPLVGLAARVEWAALPGVIADPAFADAVLLSLATCLVAVAIVVVLGLPLALRLAGDSPSGGMTRLLVLLPMALPPVVAGLALLSTFGRNGLLGPFLSSLGLEVGFTTAAVVIAQVFVALPYFVVTAESALRVMDPALPRSLVALGGSRARVLRFGVLPEIAPALISGAALSFARALGEFGATLTFAGSMQGTTRTMPLEIYLRRESDPALADALALTLILIAGAVLAAGLGLARLLTRTSTTTQSTRDTASSVPSSVERPAASEVATTAAPVRGAQPAPLTAHIRHESRGVDVELHVAPGENLAVLGPNGAGKSTTLGVLAGVLDAPGSEIPTGVRGGTALLTQRPGLGTTRTVEAAVGIAGRVRGSSSAQASEAARAALSQVGVTDLAERHVGTLSGGQQARVALARALAVDPKILLLDEPFAALDIDAARRLRNVVGRLGHTMVLATHDLLDVVHLADRVVVLEDGRVVEEAPTPQFLAAPVSDFGQRFVGAFRVHGTAVAGVVTVAGTEVPGRFDGGDGDVVMTVRARNVEVVAPGEGHLDAVVVEEAPSVGAVVVILALADGQHFAVEVDAQVSRGLGSLLGVRLATYDWSLAVRGDG